MTSSLTRSRLLALSASVAASMFIDLQGQSGFVALRPDGVDPQSVCGTEAFRHLRAQATPVSGITDGEPLFFDQDPPLLRPNHDGEITLRNFNVAGDFPTVQFRRYDPNASEGRLETWRRVNSRAVGGRVISLFEPSWPSSELATTLAHYRYGVDLPDLFWGSLLVPGTSDERPVRLRMTLDGIPESDVVRLNERVQYASNVVNIVVAEFGDGRVTGGQTAFELSTATRIFYQYFPDESDVIALQPQAMTLADNLGAFHRNVRNDVRGINLPLFDQASAYGSAGVLKGVEVFVASASARYESTNHEMAHQWGSDFDWTRISGITRAGHQPSAHSPLWTGGETLIGAVLVGDRRVRAVAGGYEIERTAAPARYHPIELYSMGTLDAADVPDFAVFSDQGQFVVDSSSSPPVGAALKGDTKPVNIDDVIRVHGPRTGPSPTVWRRTTIVVSRDRLISKAEMDYWNFFSARLADRTESNPPTYVGYAPFRTATGNRTSLSTAVHPLNQGGLPEVLDTATNAIGAAAWRDVTFSAPVSSRFREGERTTLTGRVTAADAVDFSQISVLFYKVDGSNPIRFNGSVSRSRDFTVSVQFTEAQRGQYYMAAFLFWPKSAAQFPRSSVSTITVQ